MRTKAELEDVVEKILQTREKIRLHYQKVYPDGAQDQRNPQKVERRKTWAAQAANADIKLNKFLTEEARKHLDTKEQEIIDNFTRNRMEASRQQDKKDDEMHKAMEQQQAQAEQEVADLIQRKLQENAAFKACMGTDKCDVDDIRGSKRRMDSNGQTIQTNKGGQGQTAAAQSSEGNGSDKPVPEDKNEEDISSMDEDMEKWREVQKEDDNGDKSPDAGQSDKEHETARQRKQRQVDKITQKMEAKMVAAGKIQGDPEKTGRTRHTGKKNVAKEGKDKQEAPE